MLVSPQNPGMEAKSCSQVLPSNKQTSMELSQMGQGIVFMFDMGASGFRWVTC